jgi:hypothetical protein
MSLFVPCSPDGACLQRSVFPLALATSPQKSVRLIGWILAALYSSFLQNVHFDFRKLNRIVVEAS